MPELSNRTLISICFVVLAVLVKIWHWWRRGGRRVAYRRKWTDRRGKAQLQWVRCADRAGAAGYPAANPDRPALLPSSPSFPQAPAQKERLSAAGVPLLETAGDMMRWLKIDVRRAVALANPANRVRPRKTNYGEWTVPKKRGGVRVICSPKPRLRTIQRKIKAEILDRAALHDAVHGFRRERGIVSNASSHVGRKLVVKFDLRDFFEHVRKPLVVGVFRRMGYSRDVSRWLAMFCTHRPNLGEFQESKLFGAQVRLWPRHAVQGAPTSPGLANLALHRFDCRMAGLAKKFEATYTRYADDLTFSGDERFKRGMKRFLVVVRHIVSEEGFSLNDRKARFARPGHRQRVTGVVVNEKLNCARDEYDKLKAILHNAAKAGGLSTQNREGHADFAGHIRGRIAHIAMLNPPRGARLLARFAVLAA